MTWAKSTSLLQSTGTKKKLNTLVLRLRHPSRIWPKQNKPSRTKIAKKILIRKTMRKRKNLQIENSWHFSIPTKQESSLRIGSFLSTQPSIYLPLRSLTFMQSSDPREITSSRRRLFMTSRRSITTMKLSRIQFSTSPSTSLPAISTKPTRASRTSKTLQFGKKWPSCVWNARG